jgi:hypothetical protein
MTTEGNQGLLQKLRSVRDSAMGDMAKVTLAWTSSDTFQSLNAVISKPALLSAAMFRKASDAAMADLLAALNVPSRTEVLALSQRLTRLEMALDDIAAGVEDIRRGLHPKRQAPAQQHEGNGETRSAARP